MKRALIILFLILIFIIIGIKSAYAFDLYRPNNKFGIHLAQPNLSDLKKAREMVNANGGDWGYVTLVIQDDDRNREKWQEIFDLLREHHLIPIIRLATKPDGSSWIRPRRDDIDKWVNFLDSLNWVIKNRYVILFNEPNHGSEWGGAVDAEDYSNTAIEFAKKLKEKSPDFFIILAGLDASAPSSLPVYESEEGFLRQVVDSSTQILSRESLPAKTRALESEKFAIDSSIKNIFDLIDGFSSHSYPNPAFSGSPWDNGRGTVRTYEWELGLLGRLGVNKKLPIFITETGWSASSLTRETIASYLENAYQNIWLPDDRVIAVTPFVLDYQGEPFLNFSWKEFQNEAFYPQYYTVQSLQKTKGDPEQIDTGTLTVNLPHELVANSSFHFRVKLKNNGQAIWDENDGYQLSVVSNQKQKIIEYFFSDLKNIKPFEEAEIDFYLKTNNHVFHYDRDEIHNMKLVLVKNGKNVIEKDWKFEVMPLPSLKFEVGLFPKLTTEGKYFEIQVFDEKEELVFKKAGLRVIKGAGIVSDVRNIIPEKPYRIVIINQYYLPRQGFIVFKRSGNSIQFKRMFPFDFNQNGQLDLGDLRALVQNPKLMQMFFP